MALNGRRIAARTRKRVGSLTDSDGTLDSDTAPSEPGTSPDGDTDDGIGIGIDIGISL